MSRKVSIWLSLLAILLILWSGAFASYIYEITGPDYRAIRQADGIVILTGTAPRLDTGFGLLKSGAGKRMLISGVNKQINRETLRLAVGESTAIMSCCVDLDHTARDTVGNAYETSLWAAENKFNKLLIVTSAFHMPRSLVEMKRQMPLLQLYPYAVQEDTMKLEKWWQSPSVSYVLISEFNKFLVSLIRANLERLAMGEVPK